MDFIRVGTAVLQVSPFIVSPPSAIGLLANSESIPSTNIVLSYLGAHLLVAYIARLH